MSLNKVAIIQARMSSSRLPGKVLLEIAGVPMLQHVMNRVKQAELVDQVVIATTSDTSDDILEQFCLDLSLPCYRGSLADVLDRFYQASCQYQADVIIRLTADCPLLDPGLLDRTVKVFLGEITGTSEAGHMTGAATRDANPVDFAANRLPPPWQRTLPIGLDVEVCSFKALEQACKQADQLYQREHVMPYLYEGVEFARQEWNENKEWYIQHGTTEHGFNVALLNHAPDYGSLRWTVDTPEDLAFVRQVYAQFEGRTDFGWEDVLALLDEKPELAQINAGVAHKSAFDVDKRQTKQ